jgi:hypothetical protein
MAKKDYGDPWDNDPGDEPDFTVDEEFQACRESGMKPEDFWDKDKGERYRKWLEANKSTA